MKPLRVALVGESRTGKDTIGKLIRSNYGMEPFLIAFGDDLKRNFHQTFPDIPMEPKPRQGYLDYGQFCRGIDTRVWIKALERRMNNLIEHGYESFVITDLRQVNEAIWARENSFILIRVRASEQNQIERSKDDKEIVLKNETENLIETIECDYQIVNDGSLVELELAVIKILNNIRGEL